MANPPAGEVHHRQSKARQWLFYAWYAWRFFVLRQPMPLIYGVALTDDLFMKAISADMPPERSAVLAVKGGADLLMFSAGRSGHRVRDALMAARTLSSRAIFSSAEPFAFANWATAALMASCMDLTRSST